MLYFDNIFLFYFSPFPFFFSSFSGWDGTFTPDPVPHFLHHSRFNLNYGIVLDHLVGTAASVELMDKTRRNNTTMTKSVK
jgi:sterol desaturase/sphingolipid hydroxylase (fatty acid hydroxylase superfamily)